MNRHPPAAIAHPRVRTRGITALAGLAVRVS